MTDQEFIQAAREYVSTNHPDLPIVEREEGYSVYKAHPSRVQDGKYPKGTQAGDRLVQFLVTETRGRASRNELLYVTERMLK